VSSTRSAIRLQPPRSSATRAAGHGRVRSSASTPAAARAALRAAENVSGLYGVPFSGWQNTSWSSPLYAVTLYRSRSASSRVGGIAMLSPPPRSSTPPPAGPRRAGRPGPAHPSSPREGEQTRGAAGSYLPAAPANRWRLRAPTRSAARPGGSAFDSIRLPEILARLGPWSHPFPRGGGLGRGGPHA
jgi:hypothetical protein